MAVVCATTQSRESGSLVIAGVVDVTRPLLSHVQEDDLDPANGMLHVSTAKMTGDGYSSPALASRFNVMRRKYGGDAAGHGR